MRHYFWLTKDGTIGGVLSRTGGYPPSIDPTDAKTTDPVAKHLRASYITREDFGGWHTYNCDCNEPVCSCAFNRVDDSYVVGGALVLKDVASFTVDGIALTEDEGTAATPFSAAPGAKLTVDVSAGKFSGTAGLRRGGALLTQQKTLDFAAGAAKIAVTAPAQGLTGMLALGGPRLKVVRLHILGWS